MAADHTPLFPGLEAERLRARELFGIDIELSLREWIEELGGQIRQRASTASYELGPPAVILELSSREREVLSLMAAGQSREEIAERLGIGVETVKSHAKHVRAKFRVSSTLQAVMIALLIGELDMDIIRTELLAGWHVG